MDSNSEEEPEQIVRDNFEQNRSIKSLSNTRKKVKSSRVVKSVQKRNQNGNENQINSVEKQLKNQKKLKKLLQSDFRNQDQGQDQRIKNQRDQTECRQSQRIQTQRRQAQRRQSQRRKAQKEQERKWLINHFYTNQGPYQKCSQKIKTLLDSANKNSLHLDIKLLQQTLNNLFPIKITQTNSCCNFITPHKQQVYFCYDCTKSKSKSYYRRVDTILCEDCFQNDKHQDHFVIVQPLNLYGFGYCDCGWADVLDQKSFCKKHANFKQILQCDDFGNVIQEFKEIFGGIIDLDISDRGYQGRIINIVCNCLINLNKNSIYYNRMTMELLKQKSKIQQNRTYFQMLTGSQHFINLLICLREDLKSRIQLVKFVLSHQKSQQIINKIDQSTFGHKFLTYSVCQSLIDEGFVNQNMKRLMIYFSLFDKNLEFKAQKIQIQTINSFQDLVQIGKQFNPKLAEVFVQKLLKTYPIQSNQIQVDKVNYKELNNLVLSLISKIITKQQKKMHSLPEWIHKIIGNENNSKIIFRSILKNSVDILDQSEENYIFELFLLIKDNKQLINQAWTQIHSANDKNKQSLLKIVKNIYKVIILLLNTDLFHAKYKASMIKNYQMQILNEHPERQAQILKNWFKKYLRQRKIFQVSELVKLKEEGLLNFKGIKQILSSKCDYVDKAHVFIYNPEKDKSDLHSDPLQFIPALVQLLKLENLYKSPIRFNEFIQIPKNLSASLFIHQLFVSQSLVEILNRSWEQTKSNNNFENKEQKYGYLYLHTLVLCDCLTKGQNQKLKKTLLEIVGREDLKEFYKNNEQKVLVYQLLKWSRQLQFENEVSNNAKHQKQITAIRKCANQKARNPNIYPAYLVQNSTACSKFYGQNCITKTSLTICSHQVQFETFIKKYPGTCPTCFLKRNCVLPVIIKNKNDKTAYKIAQNSFKQIQKQQSQFMIGFKHLVESCGLKSILNLGLKRSKTWCKSKTYMKNYLQKLYSMSSNQQKDQHLRDIDKLIIEAKTCSSVVFQQIQTLFIEGLRSTITGNNSMEKLKEYLLSIRSLLNEDQFDVLKLQLLMLTQINIHLPHQSQEERSKAKTSLSIPFIDLPSNAAQCLLMFKDKKCSICQDSYPGLICFICGGVFCFKCSDEQHAKKVHNSVSLFLFNGDLSLLIHKNPIDFCSDLYENDIKMVYKQRSKLDKVEDYVLSESRLERFFDQYFGN